MSEKEPSSSGKAKTKAASKTPKSTEAKSTAAKKAPSAKSTKAKANAEAKAAAKAAVAALAAPDKAAAPAKTPRAAKEAKPAKKTATRKTDSAKKAEVKLEAKTAPAEKMTEQPGPAKITKAPEPVAPQPLPPLSPKGVTRISTPPSVKKEQQARENRDQSRDNRPSESQKEYRDNKRESRDQGRDNRDHRNNGNRSQRSDDYPFAAPETVGGGDASGNKRNKRRRNRNRNGRGDQPQQQMTGSQDAPKVDTKKLARKAWKIFLGEITEDGLALMDDQSTKEVAKRAFRVAELFLQEEMRRSQPRTPLQAIQQNLDNPEEAERASSLGESEEPLTEVEEFGGDDEITPPSYDDEDDLNA